MLQILNELEQGTNSDTDSMRQTYYPTAWSRIRAAESALNIPASNRLHIEMMVRALPFPSLLFPSHSTPHTSLTVNPPPHPERKMGLRPPAAIPHRPSLRRLRRPPLPEIHQRQRHQRPRPGPDPIRLPEPILPRRPRRQRAHRRRRVQPQRRGRRAVEQSALRAAGGPRRLVRAVVRGADHRVREAGGLALLELEGGFGRLAVVVSGWVPFFFFFFFFFFFLVLTPVLALRWGVGDINEADWCRAAAVAAHAIPTNLDDAVNSDPCAGY